MKKQPKKARVRYDSGKESGQEKYVLEIWSEADGDWSEVMTTRFVADAKHPEAGEEFIHYSILINVIELVTNGYQIDI